MDHGDYKINFPKSRKEWLLEVERQDKELIDWLDDFVASEEYADLLRNRVQHPANHGVAKIPRFIKRPRHRLDDDDLAEDYYEMSDSSYDNIIMMEKKVQGTLIKLKIKNTIANQRRGIEIIREKIMEAKKEYKARKLKSIEKNIDDRKKAMKTLYKEFRITVDINDLTDKVINKVLQIRNLNRNNVAIVSKNKIKVVSNILRDMKRDKEKRKMEIRTTSRIKKKEISINNDLIMDKSTVEDEPTISESALTEQVEVSEQTEDMSVLPKKEKKGKRVAMPKETKGSMKGKIISKGKVISKSSGTASKKSQKEKTLPIDNVIPQIIPNQNSRRKILPYYVMTELLENITKLYDYLKAKESYQIEDGLTKDIFLPFDQGFFSLPNKIIFKDFQPGKRYRKEITLVNGNHHAKTISHDRVIWNTDVEEDLLLEVESFGLRRVQPGMSFKVYLRFTPEVLNKTTDGKIVFLTSEMRRASSKQFVLNVVCVPLCAAVSISPTVVSFDEMPIWRARSLAKQGKNYKTVMISNAGQKECKVVVSKIFNNQTIEQEWKKIISIIRINSDDLSEGKKILSMATMEDPSSADPFPRNLVQQCVENVFNIFKFERNIFNVQPKTTMMLKCWLKNVGEAGYQVESYNFSIYERFIDGQLYCIGTQDVIVNSETTSHFLTSNVGILDFEVCVYGSVYQLDFDLTNPCKLAHHIKICFPPRMKPYLKANPGLTTILPNQTIKICLKFLPSDDILIDNKFYDADVNLLEFPVYVKVQTKGSEDTPPLKVDVFAAVTEAVGVTLEPLVKMHFDYDDGQDFYDLGTCTTIETVYLDFQINNSSLVPQQFGFLSLPPYITMTPNFGFGQLKPMQTATIRMLISPTKKDCIENKGLLKFQLVLCTIKQCGALKKTSNEKELVKKLKHMEDLVRKSRGSNTSKLKADMQALKKAIKQQSVSVTSLSNSSVSVEHFMRAVEEDELLLNLVKYDIEEEKEVSSNMEAISVTKSVTPRSNVLNFKIQVVDATAELSHQIIHFPDTPCGSQSMMSIDLIPHKAPSLINQATFEITVNNDEFEVQPSYGKLLGKKKKMIWIVVKPNVPQTVIAERIMVLKRAEIDRQQANEETTDIKEINTQKTSKKAKQKKDQNRNQTEPLTATVDDYYHAEMDVWRTTEPYLIEALFTCRITYDNSNSDNQSDRPVEEIYFKAKCQVVAPNFIHDQKYQVIDFGSVIVGSSNTRTIKFQNIQRRYITIDVSLTNPVGPYSSTAHSNSAIPPEYIYSYPIKFRPTKDDTEVEYLDVASDKTSYYFILHGVGIQPHVVFNPNFNVCRISAPKGGFQDCSFDVKNESDIELTVHLQQVCELEGAIIVPHEIVVEKGRGNTTKSQLKKTKYTAELYDDEIYALQNSFDVRKESTLFHVLDNSNIPNTYRIAPHAKCTMKIRFGEVATPRRGPSKETGSVASTKMDHGKYFIVKYNIFVGLNYIKDIIIISTLT